MIINCGFSRTIKEKRKVYQHKNVTGIVIDDMTPDSPSAEIRQRLMQHAPTGDGWAITGYCFVG